ncbi:hypothetical protein Nther_2122 [Natranaerobius thermophilus JW/NM-WN-LF]|uniref:Lipoprotein n=1 Tax=Natranaerobius thermophilus (strain ATCC BAA-1301 / DSM 18059 / JW/NM-WN-LF) TaxID=457570 RepID=B2A7I0_NATTJ|nr:hypothetical protein Nther_2122 [Natranaerobius thermophilus JW/NM-WN-LF]
MNVFKLSIITILLITMPVIFIGCDENEELTGKELIKAANQNFEEADSYRSDANLEMTTMGMVTESEMSMKYLDDENYYMDMYLTTMGQELRAKFLMENGELKVDSEDPFLGSADLTQLQEEMDLQQYEDYFFVEDSDVEETELPENFDKEGYAAYIIRPDSDKIKEMAREEAMNQPIPEKEDESPDDLVEELMDNIEIEVETLMVVDVDEQNIVYTDMDMVQIFDMDSMSEKEEGMPGMDSEMKISIKMEAEYYDYNEPLELPEI